MDAPLNILVGVALTAVLFSFGGALYLRGRKRIRSIAIMAAIPSAAVWAVGYGVWGWDHRMDWEHIRNYPLWLHVIFMTFSGSLYALVAFVPAAGVAAFPAVVQAATSMISRTLRHSS